MAKEGGDWIMLGREWDDPKRIRTPEELKNHINEVGFLPLFANKVVGFSVEDQVSPMFWWSDDPKQDPWKWREILAASGEVVYGKFFGKKAGFVSREWFPIFANYRRDGYDFDASWEDEIATYREYKVMELFEEHDELYSNEIKRLAGFGKLEHMKNFEGTIQDLQMKGYLIVRDFRKRKRKKDGVEYGWPIAVYTTPEKLLGEDAIAAGYKEDPEVSLERIVAHIQGKYPWADEKHIRGLIE